MTPLPDRDALACRQGVADGRDLERTSLRVGHGRPSSPAPLAVRREIERDRDSSRVDELDEP